MAVSGLEQRFAPLIITQPVWSPWGIGVHTPWSSQEDDHEQSLYATMKTKLKQKDLNHKELKRSSSWGGVPTFMQNAHFEELFGEKAVESNADTDNLKLSLRRVIGSTCSATSTEMTPTPSVSDMLISTDSDDSIEAIGLISKKQHNFRIVKQTPAPDPDSATTVVVRNLPFNVTREELLQAVDASGFEGLYDFVYLPHKFKEHRNLGFAFINFANAEMARQFSAMWHRSRRFMVKGMCKGVKPLNVTMATVQGHAANTHKARGAKMVRVKNTSYQPLMLASAST
jgi:hypothetical protein